MTKPPTKAAQLRAIKSAAEHIEQAANALKRLDDSLTDEQACPESLGRMRYRWLDNAKELARLYGEIAGETRE